MGCLKDDHPVFFIPTEQIRLKHFIPLISSQTVLRYSEKLERAVKKTQCHSLTTSEENVKRVRRERWHQIGVCGDVTQFL